MKALPRSVLVATLAAGCAAMVCAQQLAQAPTPETVAANNPGASSSWPYMDETTASSSAVRLPVNAQPVPESWFLKRYGFGMDVGLLGIGGEAAVSLTDSLNLRTGARYFSFSTSQTANDIPFTATARLQSEHAMLDWHPFHNGFRVSPGLLFGNSTRAFGSTTITAGSSFTLNHVTYYSSAASPVSASGAVLFAHTAPMFTLGWGNLIRGIQDGHLTFPFELGFAYMGDPKTELNFEGVACTDEAQQDCTNIADDPSIQANIAAEHTKLQSSANWLRFYPILNGGIAFRF